MVRNVAPTAFVFVVLLVSRLCAQSSKPSSVFDQQLSPYGNGQQPQLRYASESSPRNLLLLALDGETTYDDNVFRTNTLRRGDLAYALGARIAVIQQRRHFTFGLDYQPYAQLYGRASEFNGLNHALGLDADYHPSPRFGLRLRDSFSYRTGIFRPRSSPAFIPELGPPTSFNNSVLTPLARQRANVVRLDANYQKSRRASFTPFGSYQKEDFLGEVAGGGRLLGTRGLGGGLEYAYRLSEHSTLGLLYLFQNLSSGSQFRMLTHSAFASFASQLSPRVTLQLFSGPQYARIHDRGAQALVFSGIQAPTGSSLRILWSAAGGGTLVRRSEKTVLQISAQRVLTDGGGLIPSAAESSVALTVQRRLGARWDAIWNLSAARTDALVFRFLSSSIRSQSAGFTLAHSLTPRLAAYLTYNFTRQRGASSLPSFGNFHQNHVSLGLSYELKAIPLGR